MTLSESGISLQFPDNNAFRFQDCPGFLNLKGSHFKEMDACWFDALNARLYLVELKDYTAATLSATGNYPVESRIWDLVKKSVDSLQMVNSIKLKTAWSPQLTACAPNQLPDKFSLAFLTIVNINPAQKADLVYIKDEYRRRFLSYAKLFDVQDYVILSYDKARQLFAWVV